MARKKKSDTQWLQPATPPPPLFTGVKEKDFVKQINDELIERVIGQQVAYFSIDIDRSGFHPIYGEAIEKTFLPPIRVYALVKWEGQTNLFTEGLGIDKQTSIEIHFHKRRLTEDQDLFVREGDFVLYGDRYYEIVSTAEPKQLFGQAESRFEIVAKCKRARDSLFAPSFTAGTIATRRETTTTTVPYTTGGNGIVRPNGNAGGASSGTFLDVIARNNLYVSGSSVLGNDSSDRTSVTGALGVSGSFTLNGALFLNAILITSSYSIASADYYIGVNTNYSGIVVTLPSISSIPSGRTIIIKDEVGLADQVGKSFTVSASAGQTIDGDSFVVVNVDHGSLNLYNTATGWHLF
jgi:hypothetical protein